MLVLYSDIDDTENRISHTNVREGFTFCAPIRAFRAAIIVNHYPLQRKIVFLKTPLGLLKHVLHLVPTLQTLTCQFENLSKQTVVLWTQLSLKRAVNLGVRGRDVVWLAGQIIGP